MLGGSFTAFGLFSDVDRFLSAASLLFLLVFFGLDLISVKGRDVDVEA